MDDIVKQALAKWPNVPHCYGWLGLDARGNWYLRDDRTQAAGPFAVAKGSMLQHEKLIDFIQRNYEHDDAGQWFFQNGPQRVYVELEAAPWVWRVGEDFSVSRTPAWRSNRPPACSTKRASSIWSRPSGSGWSTRRTSAWRPRPSSRGDGCRRTCGPRTCPRASGM